MKEEDRICRLCKEDKEILKHVIQECKITGDGSKNWKEAVRDDGEISQFYPTKKAHMGPTWDACGSHVTPLWILVGTM